MKLKFWQHYSLIHSLHSSFISCLSTVLHGISSQSGIQFRIMQCISLSCVSIPFAERWACSNKITPAIKRQSCDLNTALSLGSKTHAHHHSSTPNIAFTCGLLSTSWRAEKVFMPRVLRFFYMSVLLCCRAGVKCPVLQMWQRQAPFPRDCSDQRL